MTSTLARLREDTRRAPARLERLSSGGGRVLGPGRLTESTELAFRDVEARVARAINDRYAAALQGQGLPAPEYDPCTVIACYEDKAVYRCYSGDDCRTYNVPYSIGADGVVTLGEAREVVMTFAPVAESTRPTAPATPRAAELAALREQIDSLHDQLVESRVAEILAGGPSETAPQHLSLSEREAWTLLEQFGGRIAPIFTRSRVRVILEPTLPAARGAVVFDPLSEQFVIALQAPALLRERYGEQQWSARDALATAFHELAHVVQDGDRLKTAATAHAGRPVLREGVQGVRLDLAGYLEATSRIVASESQAAYDSREAPIVAWADQRMTRLDRLLG